LGKETVCSCCNGRRKGRGALSKKTFGRHVQTATGRWRLESSREGGKGGKEEKAILRCPLCWPLWGGENIHKNERKETIRPWENKTLGMTGCQGTGKATLVQVPIWEGLLKRKSAVFAKGDSVGEKKKITYASRDRENVNIKKFQVNWENGFSKTRIAGLTCRLLAISTTKKKIIVGRKRAIKTITGNVKARKGQQGVST